MGGLVWRAAACCEIKPLQSVSWINKENSVLGTGIDAVWGLRIFSWYDGGPGC